MLALAIDTEFLVILAGASFVVYLYSQIIRRRVSALTSVLDQKAGHVRGILSFALEGHFHGRHIEFLTEPGGRHSPSKFIAALETHSPLAFRIAREGIGDRVMQALNMQSELKVGDPEFDRKFVLASDTPERFLPWLQRPDVRTALSAIILERGVDVLELEGSCLRLTCVNYHKRDMSPETVRAVLEQSETLLRSAESLS